ncbi:MAG: hypothetical protein AAGD01_01145 [Acidobacteriota bacterium]
MNLSPKAPVAILAKARSAARAQREALGSSRREVESLVVREKEQQLAAMVRLAMDFKREQQ